MKMCRIWRIAVALWRSVSIETRLLSARPALASAPATVWRFQAVLTSPRLSRWRPDCLSVPGQALTESHFPFPFSTQRLTGLPF